MPFNLFKLYWSCRSILNMMDSHAQEILHIVPVCAKILQHNLNDPCFLFLIQHACMFEQDWIGISLFRQSIHVWDGKGRGVNKAQPCTGCMWDPAYCWLESTVLFPGLDNRQVATEDMILSIQVPGTGGCHNIQGKRGRLFSKLGQWERL